MLADWQSRKSLKDCNDHMLTNELGCDVIFLVGSNSVEVNAHRYVLGSRSSVFFAMFYGPLATTTIQVRLPDDDEIGFRAMLRYIYCEDLHLTDDNAIATLVTANKYGILSLEDACIKWLVDSVSVSNVCLLLDLATLTCKSDLTEACLCFIQEHPNVIQSDDFLSLSYESLKELLQLRDLDVKEEDLFERVKSWALGECFRQSKMGTGTNLRDVFGSCLFLLRFPAMDVDYFRNKVVPTEILTHEEEREIIGQVHGEPIQCPKFAKQPRYKPEQIIECARFRTPVVSGHWPCIRSAISFSVDTPIAIQGFTLYNSNYLKTERDKVEVLVDILNDSVVSLPLASFMYCTSVSQRDVMYKVKCDHPFTVVPGTFYVVTTKVVRGGGEYAVYGDDGVQEVSVDGVTFQFKIPTFINSNTSITRGQIPGILFTKCSKSEIAKI